jgi:hypothetical protein
MVRRHRNNTHHNQITRNRKAMVSSSMAAQHRSKATKLPHNQPMVAATIKAKADTGFLSTVVFSMGNSRRHSTELSSHIMISSQHSTAKKLNETSTRRHRLHSLTPARGRMEMHRQMEHMAIRTMTLPMLPGVPRKASVG